VLVKAAFLLNIFVSNAKTFLAITI